MSAARRANTASPPPEGGGDGDAVACLISPEL